MLFPPCFENINQRVTEKYLNFDNGFYIEVGGADGFTQSNTWHLEKYKGWKGILVEPNSDAYYLCKDIRKNSIVYNYALVSKEFSDSSITMIHRNVYSGDPGLMTAPQDSPLRKDETWMSPKTDNDTTKEFTIPARTLDSILEENNIVRVDFFSLDVEGYELEVLKGFNLSKYEPKVLLVEWHLDITQIEEYVKDTHKLEEQLSKHDYVFTLRN
jgi:FkbM family methyltransferase